MGNHNFVAVHDSASLWKLHMCKPAQIDRFYYSHYESINNPFWLIAITSLSKPRIIVWRNNKLKTYQEVAILFSKLKLCKQEHKRMAYRYSPDLAIRCQNNCVAGSFRSTIDPFLSFTELVLLLHLSLGQRRNMLAAQVKIAIKNIAFVFWARWVFGV